jgi:organic hydroperoxide reductase OsmC/OhrA
MPPTRQDKRRHAYEVHCHWTGSTGLGYEQYDRTHLASAPPASPALTLSADRVFGGDPNLLNPEQLLVLAAMSCQLLSFLAVAARAHIDVLEYDDVGEGVMLEDDVPVRITEINLRPVIRLGSGPTEERILHLVEVAHDECYIANSLRTRISIEPRIIIQPNPSSM